LPHCESESTPGGQAQKGNQIANASKVEFQRLRKFRHFPADSKAKSNSLKLSLKCFVQKQWEVRQARKRQNEGQGQGQGRQAQAKSKSTAFHTQASSVPINFAADLRKFRRTHPRLCLQSTESVTLSVCTPKLPKHRIQLVGFANFFSKLSLGEIQFYGELTSENVWQVT